MRKTKIQLEEVKSISPKDMWLEELDNLEKYL